MSSIHVGALKLRIESLEAELAYLKGEVLPKVVVREGQSVIAVGKKNGRFFAIRIGNYWTSDVSFEPWMETAPPVPYDQSRFLDIRAYFDKEDEE